MSSFRRTSKYSSWDKEEAAFAAISGTLIGAAVIVVFVMIAIALFHSPVGVLIGFGGVLLVAGWLYGLYRFILWWKNDRNK